MREKERAREIQKERERERESTGGSACQRRYPRAEQNAAYPVGCRNSQNVRLSYTPTYTLLPHAVSRLLLRIFASHSSPSPTALLVLSLQHQCCERSLLETSVHECFCRVQILTDAWISYVCASMYGCGGVCTWFHVCTRALGKAVSVYMCVCVCV